MKTTHPISDSLTMLRRNIRHNLKAPLGTVIVITIPVLFLLIFVFIFGDTLGAGINGGDRESYLAFITPAILIMAITSSTQMIAVWISTDVTRGIIARFRTMPISPGSVLAGHVYGGTILAVFALAVLLIVSILIGYRPGADAWDWLGFAGFAALAALAFAWFSIGFGLAAKGPETASNTTMLLLVLPMLSASGFVPGEAMPEWLRGFAEYQPFTPIIKTFRGLLAGTPDLSDALVGIAWLIGIIIAFSIWSRRLYRRRAAQR